jgi:hypothetical protein
LGRGRGAGAGPGQIDFVGTRGLGSWQDLPGFDRFQAALKLTDHAAFTADGFLRWLNRVRPADHPPIAEVPVTVAGTADDVDEFFQSRIDWWSGGKKSG